MAEIVQMQRGHERWDETAAFAEGCPWKAGPLLAQWMREKAFLDWERVFAAYENGAPVGFCTLTDRDELPEGYGFSPFIGFVFVDEAHRGRRLSEALVNAAAAHAAACGFRRVYLMSGERGLYEKYGFTLKGRYPTIYGATDQLFERPTAT